MLPEFCHWYIILLYFHYWFNIDFYCNCRTAANENLCLDARLFQIFTHALYATLPVRDAHHYSPVSFWCLFIEYFLYFRIYQFYTYSNVTHAAYGTIQIDCKEMIAATLLRFRHIYAARVVNSRRIWNFNAWHSLLNYALLEPRHFRILTYWFIYWYWYWYNTSDIYTFRHYFTCASRAIFAFFWLSINIILVLIDIVTFL